MTNKQTTWPPRSNGSPFTSYPPPKSNARKIHHIKNNRKTLATSSSSTSPPAATSPISRQSSWPKSASLSATTASKQLRSPARRGATRSGSRGRPSGTSPSARSSSTAAELGSTKGMVDAGLIHWERGETDTAFGLYLKAAEADDRNAQFNLGMWYLQVEPPIAEEAVRWLYCAAIQGHARAQYQLAICLYQGRGAARNMKQAARWYLRAAELGYVRAMYNVSLCYKYGEGLVQSHRQARHWMESAADHGHGKAQYEHGLALFSEGKKVRAVVYLELAIEAGERTGRHLRNVIYEQLSPASCYEAMCLLQNWRALPSHS